MADESEKKEKGIRKKAYQEIQESYVHERPAPESSAPPPRETQSEKPNEASPQSEKKPKKEG